MLTVRTWMQNADGSRNHGVDGFTDAHVLVSGDRAKDVATEIAHASNSLREQGEALLDLAQQLHAAKAALPPKRPANLLGEGCVRQDQTTPGVLWLLGRADRGWASFGFRVGSWDDLFRRFNVVIGSPVVDAHGMYWPASPAPESVL